MHTFASILRGALHVLVEQDTNWKMMVWHAKKVNCKNKTIVVCEVISKHL